MVNRRDFLGAIGLPAASAVLGGFALTTLDPRRASAIAANLAQHNGEANAIAQNEDFWFRSGF